MPKALIVDDNGENRYLLQCLLSANGFEVISASNGREALDQAENAVPDLVLSDILMPVMDGFALCREWKQSVRLSPIPFVFYTATYTEPKDEQFALSLGADLFIVKPAEPTELVRLVHQVLEKRNQGELQPRESTITDETPYLRQYNEVLIRKLEEKLFQVERANQRLLIKDFAIESSKAGLAMADLSGRINYANPSFLRLWRKGDEDLLGRTLEFLFDAEGKWTSVLRHLRETNYWSGQLVGQGKLSGRFIALTEIQSVLDAQGTPLCLMVACTDITEQERMRQQLQRSQRMESLSQLAAGIAHDFNNLLTAIFANLDLSNADSSMVPDPARKAAMLSAFERARDMTRRLLNFGKGANAPRQIVSVSGIIEESCQLSLSGASTELCLRFVEPISSVHANATELSEVFCNLILNARQAMKDAGKLCVTVTNRTVHEREETQLKPGEYVLVEIQDSGPGIDAAEQQRIFEPFFTSKREGSGLGLAMSRAIVSGYAGHVDVVSSMGHGATFRVWLPASDQTAMSQPPKSVREFAQGSGRILVLDDEEVICRLVAHQLERQGYGVQVASDGEQAIELYRKARAEGHPFDLLILDLTVRGGMGGFETLAVLRQEDRAVVALACSGLADDATIAEVKASGFAGLLAKPFLGHELASMVKAAMATRA